MKAKTKLVKELTEEETLSYIRRHAKEACHLFPHALVMPVAKVKTILTKGCLVGKLNERFESVCDEYLEAFCLKHDLYVDYDWVGKNVGGVVTIGDYFINFDDIRLDIDQNAPEPCFFKWYDVALDYVTEHGTTEGCANYKTFLSYFMGFSYGKESKK
jgi:hypothetical protein